MYRNNEGYADPTVGAAMSTLMKEYKAMKRKQYLIRHRKKVYIASPYAGDVENNVAKAISYCRFAIRKNYMPIASHLLYPQILDDSNPKERELGTMFGMALLEICDEVWVFGRSPGVNAEIREAEKLGKPIKYYRTEETK